jgi:large subunit ribosomal protein L17
MRHNASGRKLGRTTSHRLALFRNQLASLMAAERIVTTLPKAKELRPLAERLVTQGKRGTVHARRMVGRWIPNRELIKKIFDQIAPRFAERPGGYLRIVKLGSRQGDGAELAVLEFVDFQLKKPVTKTAEGGEKADKAKKAEKATESAAAEEKAKKAPRKKAEAPRAKADAKPKTAPVKKASTAKKIGGS